MIRQKSALLLLSASLIAASILACSAPQQATPSLATATPETSPPTPEPPTSEPPTSTPVPPTSTPVPPTVTPEPPIPTPEPPAPVEPEPTRIAFGPGRTSATVSGYVEQNGIARYVLRALADQAMAVDITSPNDDVLLSIWGADGLPLKRHVDDRAYWRGRLPSTQDYFIQAVSVGAATNYELHVTAFARIQFEPGATSATVTGDIEQNGIRHYVVRALAGQTMDVRITSPNGDVLLTIWGEDGVPLKRYVDDRADWRGELYATQDYYVEAVAVGGATNYTLAVAISPLGSEPARLQFAPGATSTTVTGWLDEGGDDASYVVRASAGQTMEIYILPAGWGGGIEVEGQDGSAWRAPSSANTLTVALPVTQDYVITLSTPAGAGAVQYTMDVTIPPP